MTEDKPLSERPLDLRVAEALGMIECDKWSHFAFETMRANCAHRFGTCYPKGAVPRFSTQWGWGGPLIEKHKLYVYYDDDHKCWVVQPHTSFAPGRDHYPAKTPLEAVCECVLALAEAGKLEER